jgi:hypothetical protein
MSDPENSQSEKPESGRDARRGLWSRQVDVSFLWLTPWRHPTETILGLGVLLRVFVYLWNRSYWLDEGTLLGNIEGIPPFEFSGHLGGDQLAPFGFLVAERLLVGWFGSSGYVTRLIPLVCGIGSLWLFRWLALRWLSFWAAVVALLMFAMSDDLVYYSSELKPYSSDLAVSLGVLVAAAKVRDEPPRGKTAAGLVLLVLAAPWISFPSAFTIAGVGLAVLVDRLARLQWRDSVWLVALAGAWLVSFALAYRASHALLHPATSMYVFWNFAFLAAPPWALSDFWKFGGVLLEVVVNPLNLVPPSLPAHSVGLALCLLVAGVIGMARRDRTALLMLLIPILLAVGATAARRYPFHGRLILGLVPAFFLLLAEGLDRVRATFGRKASFATALLLLAYPCWTTLYENSGERMRDFNPHSDIHRNRFVP